MQSSSLHCSVHATLLLNRLCRGHGCGLWRRTAALQTFPNPLAEEIFNRGGSDINSFSFPADKQRRRHHGTPPSVDFSRQGSQRVFFFLRAEKSHGKETGTPNRLIRILWKQHRLVSPCFFGSKEQSFNFYEVRQHFTCYSTAKNHIMYLTHAQWVRHRAQGLRHSA